MTGPELKDHRLKLNMSQAELASALGVHRVSVTRYENGDIPIPKMLVLALKSIRKKRSSLS